MKLLRRSNKTNVRRSTRSRNRMHQTLDLDLDITHEDIPPFGSDWEPPSTETETPEILELRRSA